jgi:hypothetical protein
MIEYVCEVCDKRQVLTERGAFDAGWDYPPFIGEWGVVSPRTCGGADCGIDKTAYWALMTGKHLSDRQQDTVARILEELGRRG